MDANDNPYKILGVSQDASATDIKKAFRKLALKHHPDKQTNDADRAKANDIFAKISNAYEILSDEEQRKQYDWQSEAPTSRTRSPRTATSSHPMQTTSTTTTKTTTTTTHGGMPSTRTSTKSKFYTPEGNFTSNSFRDPFDVFADVFKEEFDDQPKSKRKSSKSSNTEGLLPPGAKQVSMQTAMKMVQGKSVTVTERTFELPDGTLTTRVDKAVAHHGANTSNTKSVPTTKSKSYQPSSPKPSTKVSTSKLVSPKKTKTVSKSTKPAISVEIVNGMKETTTTFPDGRSQTKVEPIDNGNTSRSTTTSTSSKVKQPSTKTKPSRTSTPNSTTMTSLSSPTTTTTTTTTSSRRLSSPSSTNKNTGMIKSPKKKKDKQLTTTTTTTPTTQSTSSSTSSSTSTKIVNGKREITTTYTVQRADGSMESRMEKRIEAI